jgi:hypothetical protein
MFLTKKDYSLEEFLASLNFIPPAGTTVAYFISPQGIALPRGSGYAPQAEQHPDDESITYVKQEPALKQDQAQTPSEYSVFNTGELGRRQPTPNVLPPITEPAELPSPFVKIISESQTYGSDLKLLEDYQMFPAGTLFHCVLSNRLSEGYLDDLKSRRDDPEFQAARANYLKKKQAKASAAAARKADRKENEFTFNQLAKMVPDGVEPEFVPTRTPFIYDIRIGDKLYKRISRPDAKIERYRLVEKKLFEIAHDTIENARKKKR